MIESALNNGWINESQYTDLRAKKSIGFTDLEIAQYIEEYRTIGTEPIKDVQAVQTVTEVKKQYKQKSNVKASGIDIGSLDAVETKVNRNYDIWIDIDSSIMRKDINFNLYCVLKRLTRYEEYIDPTLPKQNRIFFEDYTTKEVLNYTATGGKTNKPISPNTFKKDRKALIESNVVEKELDEMGEYTEQILMFNEIPTGHFKMKFNSTTLDNITTNIPSDELRVFLYLANFKEGLYKKDKKATLQLNSNTIYEYCFGDYGATKEGVEPTAENIKKKQKSDSKKIYTIIDSLESKGYLKTTSIGNKTKSKYSYIFRIDAIIYPKVNGRVEQTIKQSNNVTKLKIG